MTVLLQLSAGRGPGECRLAVEGLCGVLVREAASSGLTAAVVETVPGSPGLNNPVLKMTNFTEYEEWQNNTTAQLGYVSKIKVAF